jgi:hypothetical protein
MNRNRVRLSIIWLDGLTRLAQIRPRDSGKVEGHRSHPVFLEQPLSQRVRREADLIWSSPSHPGNRACLDLVQVLAKVPTTKQLPIFHRGHSAVHDQHSARCSCVSDLGTAFTTSRPRERPYPGLRKVGATTGLCHCDGRDDLAGAGAG